VRSLWVQVKKSSAKIKVLKEEKALHLSAQRPRVVSVAK